MYGDALDSFDFESSIAGFFAASFDTTGGTITQDAANKFAGSYGGRLNRTNAGAGIWMEHTIAGTKPEVTGTFWWRPAALLVGSSAQAMWFQVSVSGGAGNDYWAELSASGAVTLSRSGSLRTSAVATVSAGTPVRVDWRMDCNQNPVIWGMRINGGAEVVLSDAVSAGTKANTVLFGSWDGAQNGTYDFTIDDLRLYEGAGAGYDALPAAAAPAPLPAFEQAPSGLIVPRREQRRIVLV